jgi:hypothetical protein
MNGKPTVLFYVRGVNEVDREFEKAIEGSLPKDQVELCKSLEEFLAKLRIVERDALVALLLASDKQDLREIIFIKPFLGNVRSILVLPDRDEETIAMGHTLLPRFIAYRDGDWHETAAVLEKMLERMGTPKRPRLSGRQAEPLKYLYQDRGYPMVSGRSQIKSLPPFIYNRKIQLREADLNGIISGLEGLFPKHTAANINFKTAREGETLRVMADSARIGEALLHLIKNAKDAMPIGGELTFETRRVDLENALIGVDNAQLTGTCVLCSISDTGTGMDGETLKRVFEPFFTTKQGEGKGLGLPIARHIIKQHKGGMNVESTPGKGTTVNIYLPLLTGEPVGAIPIPIPIPIHIPG